MIVRSIRWRLQLWVAFLLICVLSGFGMTVYQLQRLRQLNLIDQDLEGRVEALALQLRRGPGPPGGGGPDSFWREKRRKGGPPPEPDLEPQPAGDRAGGVGDNSLPEGPRLRKPYLPRGFPDRGGGPDGKEFEPPDAFKGMPSGFRDVQLSAEVIQMFQDACYYSIWARDGTLLKQSTNAPANLSWMERKSDESRTHARTREGWREVFHFTELGDCVMAGSPLAGFQAAMRRFTSILLAAGSGVLALGLGGAWWLTGRTIRPIAQIGAAASRISAGNLSERINVLAADDELGRLAAVLNNTFARLEAAFGQQARFTADASHELRTPLAVMITEAQAALARQRSASEYRETVEGCLATAQQMRRLVESLLELARFDAGQQAMRQEAVDLGAIGSECISLVRPLARERAIQIDCDPPSVQCVGDPDKIRQVFTNLLTNAIDYNRKGGRVRVTLEADNRNVRLTVADNGPGIPAEDLPHIFERFHRADKGRTTAAGHSGLGLAITQAIVHGHGGTIVAESEPGKGATFRVSLPQGRE